MSSKSYSDKEYNKGKRERDQFFKKEERERKKQRSQSDFVSHPNQYRRKKQKDREESLINY